jgi:hypothetical protein
MAYAVIVIIESTRVQSQEWSPLESTRKMNVFTLGDLDLCQGSQPRRWSSPFDLTGCQRAVGVIDLDKPGDAVAAAGWIGIGEGEREVDACSSGTAPADDNHPVFSRMHDQGIVQPGNRPAPLSKRLLAAAAVERNPGRVVGDLPGHRVRAGVGQQGFPGCGQN